MAGEGHEESILQRQQGVFTTIMVTVLQTTDASMQGTHGHLALCYQTRQRAAEKSFPRDNIKPGPCIGRSMKSV